MKLARSSSISIVPEHVWKMLVVSLIFGKTVCLFLVVVVVVVVVLSFLFVVVVGGRLSDQKKMIGREERDGIGEFD